MIDSGGVSYGIEIVQKKASLVDENKHLSALSDGRSDQNPTRLRVTVICIRQKIRLILPSVLPIMQRAELAAVK